MSTLLKVKEPGLLLTIQDLGRSGYQHLGVPISGVMDRYALVTGNLLLGNNRNAAALEITLGGTELTFLKETVVCLTGADLAPHVDRKGVPMWETFKVKEGQTLVLERPVQGVRSYLCVSGGVQSEQWLGSQSVFERGSMGKRLSQGDFVNQNESGDQPSFGSTLRRDLRPVYTKDVKLRVIPSYQESCFEEESVAYFYESTYTFKKGDRMGCMLEGEEPLKHRGTADIVSDAVTFGTIQVPSNGQPMVLLADSQTTGGYTTVGTVVSVDHWKLAQLIPGSKVNFTRLPLEEAEDLLSEWKEV
ncbi:biotin-dependent carboxyltransferase family protein [Alkalibacillus silvisoli]|uniref:Biotin-dependent carboxyltransferase family protein n=1 Tax=Alkalibacillus silvisoli TaxID=392823 RepID=A0ABN0ZL07_9BACI